MTLFSCCDGKLLSKKNNSFTYQASKDADSPEADAELVTETILFVSKNYPQVRTT